MVAGQRRSSSQGTWEEPAEINVVAARRAGVLKGLVWSLAQSEYCHSYYSYVLIVWHSAYWHSINGGGGQLMLYLLHTVPPLWEEDLEDLEKVKGSPTLRC